MRRAALLLLLVAATLTATVAASEQATVACSYCGGSFAAAADEEHVDVTVAESEATVRVHANGSATWTVRNRLSAGADAFRERPERLDAVAELIASGWLGRPESSRVLDARMEGDTAVVVARDHDAARRHAGLLVVDYLHEGPRDSWLVMNADRFTVRGPPGTVVANTPATGRAAGRNVTWRGQMTDAHAGGRSLDGSAYVVFGPDRSVVTTARSGVAVGLATLPIVTDTVGTYVVPQTALFAAILAGAVALLRRTDVSPRSEVLAVAVGGGSVLVAAGIASAWNLMPSFGAPLAGVLVAVAAASDRGRGHLSTPRRQAAVVGAVLLAVFLLVAAWGLLVGDRRLVGTAGHVAAVTLPLAAMLPLGGAVDRDRGTVLRWGAVAVLAFAAMATAIVDPTDPPTGLGAGLAAVFLYGYAVLAPLVGVLVLLLGRSLAGLRSP